MLLQISSSQKSLLMTLKHRSAEEAISKKKKNHGYIISPETVSKRTGMSETQITNAFSSPKQNPTDCPPNCSTIPKLEKNNNKTSPHFQTKPKL